jgi:amino acid permease
LLDPSGRRLKGVTVSDDLQGLFTRDELLGGLPARRASTLLFAIEARTAHLVARSRRALATFQTEKTGADQERAFLDAMAQGRDLPLSPTIQDLERYALAWADLVPPDPGLRAALARMIGEKYQLPQEGIPGLRRSLGLDDEAVRQTFERLHGRPLDTIYRVPISRQKRLRWARARLAHRLESLPPFWTAFSLTLTETVGAGILALPIALAEIGPLGGVAMLVVLGLVNMVTLAAVAESAARNGNVRYGRAYFGRLVSDYLGRPVASFLKPTMVVTGVIVLVAYFVGLSSTLAGATGLAPEYWAALVFLTVLYFLRRQTLDATVASALFVGAINIGLILLIAMLAVPHLHGSYLRHSRVPFLSGESFDASTLALSLGVVLGAFFGHTSATNCAAVVLERDPTARSFIRGSVAAMATAIVLYCIWVAAITGAVGPAALTGLSGTTLEPLAAVVGPSVDVLGSIFAVLAMGMGSMHCSLGLFNQTREWVPPMWGARDPVDTRSRVRALIDDRRFWLATLPIAVTFLGVELMLAADRESFAGPLGFLGAVTSPVLAGVFPMLMVVASRRQSDCALGPVWRWMGHPVVVAGISLVFLSVLLLYGLVIWEEPYQRATALLAAIASVTVAIVAAKLGAFHPRAVIELRLDADPRVEPVVNVVARGTPVLADVQWSAIGQAPLHRNLGGRTVRIGLERLPVCELKLWVHRLTGDGGSEPVPAQVELEYADECRQIDLSPASGEVVVPTKGEAQQIAITKLGDVTIERRR